MKIKTLLKQKGYAVALFGLPYLHGSKSLFPKIIINFTIIMYSQKKVGSGGKENIDFLYIPESQQHKILMHAKKLACEKMGSKLKIRPSDITIANGWYDTTIQISLSKKF